MIEDTLSGRVKAERKRRRWSQAEVAQKAGVAERTYQSFENGETKPQSGTLSAILAALELEASGMPQQSSIDVDDTTARLITMLREVLTDEPETPDPETHDGHHMAEVAMTHYEWARQVAALRLLIGVRLTNAALDGAGTEQPRSYEVGSNTHTVTERVSSNTHGTSP